MCLHDFHRNVLFLEQQKKFLSGIGKVKWFCKTTNKIVPYPAIDISQVLCSFEMNVMDMQNETQVPQQPLRCSIHEGTRSNPQKYFYEAVHTHKLSKRYENIYTKVCKLRIEQRKLRVPTDTHHACTWEYSSATPSIFGSQRISIVSV